MPESNDYLEIFLMYFDNEINTTIYSKYSQTCLSKLRSTGIPAIRNKLLGNSKTLLSDTDLQI